MLHCRHYMDEAQVAYGKTPGDAQAVSALVHAMVKLDRVASKCWYRWSTLPNT